MASKLCRYKGEDFALNYTRLNPDRTRSILILHGWGSNQQIMQQAFGKHLPEYQHIYVDMPGFGKSPNDRALTTEDYAAILQIFLEQIGVTPEIIAGHSFGGKVATLLNPSCLVLLSSSGIRVPKEFAVRIKIALFKILKPLKLDRLHQLFISDDAKGMPTHMYETFKNVVNEDFAHYFDDVQGRALLFWGEKDTATPLWTGEQISKIIDNSKLIPMEGDHFFFLKHGAEIAKIIIEECVA